MLNIIGRKNIYFLISLLVIIPGLISLLLWGLRPSIDFTGGSKLTFLSKKPITQQQVNEVKNVFSNEKVEIVTLNKKDTRIIIQTKPLTEKQDTKILIELKKKSEDLKQEEFETIGPTIGKETTYNAIKTIFFASILIVIYISYSFRKVPKPASSLRFGICAIIALLHDGLLVVGIFSILGHFFNVWWRKHKVVCCCAFDRHN